MMCLLPQRAAKKTNKIQAYILLNLAGGEAIEWEVFANEESENKEDTECLKRGESIQSFVADLKNKASACEFGELKDEMIKDRLVCGVENQRLRRNVLREGKLTLQKAIELCQIN